MLERILNAALEGEMDAHLNEEGREGGNRRNGKMSKTVQTRYGEVNVETPRDRDGSFDPQTVRKRETILAEGMADQIIGMYAFGTSTREISRYFEREFNTKMSAETISAITDRVLPVHQGHTLSHLHHQHCRGLSPPDTQGDEEQGRVPIGYRFGETRLACIPQHLREMDIITPQLGFDISTISNKIWKQI